MDLKTSLLVGKQLPEFVREEYPLFLSFLEAYYEFLEEEQFVNNVGQKNNVIEKLKDLRNISDIDFSLKDFEEQFFNTFISYLPKETVVSKDFLIKNILPLYQSKGTEKSFQLLFRLIFGEEIQIGRPKENILRASDGKWVIENILRTELEIYSEYKSDGIKSIYSLPYEIPQSLIEIYVDDVFFSDYYVRKELKKIYFENVPDENSIIKIFYKNSFNTNIFKNRQIRGVISNATTVIEKTARRNIAGLNFYQFFVDDKTSIGTFRNGELIEITFVNENEEVIPFYLQTLSDVENVSVISPGQGYNIGDSVIFRGSATEGAVAVVDSVSSGNIDSISVKVGNFGAGYKADNEIYANGYSSNIFSAIIDAVDSSGTISPNTFSYNIDLISDYLSVNISDSDYGFPANTVFSEDIDTPIVQALSLVTIADLGPAINVETIISQIPSNEDAELIANSTLLFNDVTISNYNSIGTIKVLEGGSGYLVGENIIFTNTDFFSGQGAAAFVSSVSPTGSIRNVTVTNGGYNYNKDFLPTLSVDSFGTGANLAIEHFMGQGAEFDYVKGDGIQGKILSIKILNPGKGYTVTPIVDLKFSGDGNATAVANISSSFVKLPGRWSTSDSLLSDDDIRLQGKNYYVDFSYIISSRVEFQKYQNIIKDLLNPSGSVNYARYNLFDNVMTNTTYIVFNEFNKQIAGTVNVSTGSSIVLGTNTYFEIANNIGLLAEGTYILVNSEIRLVNSIINNSTITVSESYEFNANYQLISIVTVPYRAVTTEYWRELAITLEGPRTIVITTEE